MEVGSEEWKCGWKSEVNPHFPPGTVVDKELEHPERAMPRRRDRERREREETRQAERRARARRAEEQAERHDAALRASAGTPRGIRAVWHCAITGQAVDPRYHELNRLAHRLRRGSPEASRLMTLLRHVEKRAPKLARHDWFWALWELARQAWLRPLDAWRPKGKAARSKLRSLIDHLVVRFPLPPFLYSVFEAPQAAVRRAGVDLFVALARGASLRKLTGGPLLPAPLTRQMCHLLLASKANLELVEAVRHAQVRALGGDVRLARAVSETGLGVGFSTDEPFWATAIGWLCRQTMLDPRQVGPLVDFIRHRHDTELAFSMKGRTAAALMRGMEEWHVALRRERKLVGVRYDPSGVIGGRWELGRKKPVIWTVEEILTSRALLDEGKALRHCVYSYSHAIERKVTSIWSLRRDGERRLTIEVANTHRRIVQARGTSNRAPDDSERALLQRWATLAGLTIRLSRW